MAFLPDEAARSGREVSKSARVLYEVLCSIVEGLNGAHIGEVETAGLAPAGDDEFIQALESMAVGVPLLPRDFSRQDIYFPVD